MTASGQGNVFSEMQREVHDIAISSGWWTHEERNVGEMLMLIVTELAEAMEEYREGHELDTVRYVYRTTEKAPNSLTVVSMNSDSDDTLYRVDGQVVSRQWLLDNGYLDKKPEGFPVELADTVIRIMDLAERHDIDLSSTIAEKMAYNRTRPHRHGGKLA